MYDMIQCTDDYINYCKTALPKIKEAIDASKDEDKTAKLTKLYNNYKEMSKPPVLFLDEIRSGLLVRLGL